MKDTTENYKTLLRAIFTPYSEPSKKNDDEDIDQIRLSYVLEGTGG